MQTDVVAPARLIPPATVLPAFAGTVFLSAGLMFLVEPMVAKMVLPRLGGSPAVWSTCLVFFQAVLLLGYAYAHASVRLLSRSAQIVLHIGLVLPVAALALPLDLGTGGPSPGDSPALWLLIRLVLTVGPPVFVISATAPLLQSWFIDLDHETSADPYFLYAGSNAGSLLALLAYPLLVEPMLPLDRQATMWSLGCGALALGLGLCAVAVARRGRHSVDAAPLPAAAPLSIRERLTWIALAFVPASLLLGVTTHITTDIAAAPLLWVVPLIIYLATFILVFARRPPLRHATMAKTLPLVLIPLVITAAPGSPFMLPLPFMLALHLGCFFAVCMVCHGELAQRRPPVLHLTEFYLLLSVGGVLGGAFNALLAPLIFSGVWEYPLALVAACLMRPATPSDGPPAMLRDVLLPLALLSFVLLVRHYLALSGAEAGRLPVLILAAGWLVPAFVLLAFSPRRWRFALGIAGFLLVVPLMTASGDVMASYRSFFGVYRISATDRDHMHVLMNGTTLHGAQSLLPGEAALPLTYYSHEGPFGRFFAAVAPDAVRHVAVIGLGTGALACYARAGQDWTFYEIDPLVERIARDPRYFQFLSSCGEQSRVVLGDARQTIAAAPDANYNVLIIDAFSSDSIPMHLLTREALALYLRKLAPGGTMLFHISSRSLDLRPVIAALAADAGASARILFDRGGPPGDRRHTPALVVAVARHDGDLSQLDRADGWTELLPSAGHWLWTDQRSDLLHVIRLGF